jgi:hypothetical protein
MINRLVSLNTIKRTINQFPLKSSVIGALMNAPTNPIHTDLYGDYYLFSLGTTKQIHPYYSSINKISKNISINDYLCITEKDPCFKGFGDTNNLKDYIYYDLGYKMFKFYYDGFNDCGYWRNQKYEGDITNKFKSCELNHTEFKYSSTNAFILDKNKLFLFTRLVPNTVLDRECMTLNCKDYRLYNIADKSYKEHHTTFGFVTKFDGNYNIKINKNVYVTKKYKIKFPTLTHKLIDNRLFDGNKFYYIVQKSLLYIENNKLLDKHNIEVIDDF